MRSAGKKRSFLSLLFKHSTSCKCNLSSLWLWDYFLGDRIFAGKIYRNKPIYKFKFIMAHYVDDCPANETTVCYRRGGNLHQEITTLLSLKITLVRSFHWTYLSLDYCALTFCFATWLFHMWCFLLLNTVITCNNLWKITETISF